MVSGGNSIEWQPFEKELEYLRELFPTEILGDNSMSKEKFIELAKSGSAELIHILGHGFTVGTASYCWLGRYKREREREREKKKKERAHCMSESEQLSTV